MILFFTILMLICLFIPLICHLSFSCQETLDLELTWKLGFISVYSRTYRLTIEDLFNDYIQPILTQKKNGKKKELQKIKLTNLKWQTTIGLEHADQTALTVGLFWSLKSLIVSVCDLYFRSFDGAQYHVSPNYQGVHFKTEGRCIFSLKLGQAIYIKFKR